MIRWVLCLIWFAVIWLATCRLSPLPYIAVWLFTTPSGFYLCWPFKWMMTIDNDLTGDSGWKAEHLWGSNAASYINKVRWLWRNGGNWVNYWPLGCAYLAINQTPGIYWERPDGFWFYHRFIKVTSAKQIELMFGWNLFGPQLNRCKFVFTIRLRTVTQ